MFIGISLRFDWWLVIYVVAGTNKLRAAERRAETQNSWWFTWSEILTDEDMVSTQLLLPKTDWLAKLPTQSNQVE